MRSKLRVNRTQIEPVDDEPWHDDQQPFERVLARALDAEDHDEALADLPPPPATIDLPLPPSVTPDAVDLRLPPPPGNHLRGAYDEDEDDDVVELREPPPLRPTPPPAPLRAFWDDFEQAGHLADLLAMVPVPSIALLGPLDLVGPAISDALTGRPDGWDDVIVHTRQELPEELQRATKARTMAEMLTALGDGRFPSPIAVVDLPEPEPTWVGPVVNQLRKLGIDLVRFLTRTDPSDEDLATWHGELGHPTVFDLTTAMEPSRLMELIERGEPIRSVAGVEITAQFLMALRLEVC